MRINKFISTSGYCSRRSADKLIDENRVFINEKIATKGDDVSETDIVKIDGIILQLQSENQYIMLNKPEGYTTTLKDKFADKIVMDLLKEIDERVYPVGRLDRDSCGLLLFTNDGDLAFKLTHPNHDVEKEYLVRVNKTVSKDDLKKLSDGVIIDGRLTREARFIHTKNMSEIRVFLKEGRNRQIRKMFKTLGYDVIFLKRVAFGKIKLGILKVGEYRNLTEEEIKYLRSVKW